MIDDIALPQRAVAVLAFTLDNVPDLCKVVTMAWKSCPSGLVDSPRVGRRRVGLGRVDNHPGLITKATNLAGMLIAIDKKFRFTTTEH